MDIERIDKQITELNITLESHFRTLDYYIRKPEKLIEDQWKTLNKNFRKNITKFEEEKQELKK